MMSPAEAARAFTNRGSFLAGLDSRPEGEPFPNDKSRWHLSKDPKGGYEYTNDADERQSR